MTKAPFISVVVALSLLVLSGCRPIRDFVAPKAETTESGLTLTITQRGNGDPVGAGSLVKIHYTAMLADGTVFDDSRGREKPVLVRLSNSHLIPGLTEGIARLRIGDHATIVIPPELAYGEEGFGSVPGNATLTYKVEVIELLPSVEGLAVEDREWKRTAGGLDYIVVENGTGIQLESGMEVTVHYTGYLEDGTIFDSSRDRGEAFTFTLGRQMVIPGWEEGFQHLRVGDKARLLIPDHLAYGSRGRGPIPPNADLVFDVEVLEAGQPRQPLAFEVGEQQPLVTESGLQLIIIQEGSGSRPSKGDVLVVHYSGYLADGTLFDSSLQRNEAFRFVLGSGQVIEGWDEGFGLLRKGAKARLVVPPELGYGQQGRGPVPSGATLVFDVELIDIE